MTKLFNRFALLAVTVGAGAFFLEWMGWISEKLMVIIAITPLALGCFTIVGVMIVADLCRDYDDIDVR